MVAGMRARKGLVLRILRVVGIGLVGLLGLAILVILVVLVGINTPFGRRFVVSKVNATLAPSFQGRIVLEDLGSVGLTGLSGANATIYDPSGRPALVVRGARVGIATLAAAKSALLDTAGPLTVTLTEVAIDSLDVRVDTDPKGQLDLVNAFAPKTPAAPPDPHARGFRLVVPHIALKHMLAHGVMAGAPAIDADVNDVAASFELAPDLLAADVDNLKLTARRIANGADVSGALQAHVRKPTDPAALSGRVVWAGVVGGISHSVHASIDRGRIDAVIDAPAFAPDNVRSLWPASTLTEAGSAHVEAHGTLPDVDVDLHAALGAAALNAKGHVALGDGKSAKFAIDARGLDAKQFAATAPASSLALNADVSGSQAKSGAIAADLALRFLGGRVGENALPPAIIKAKAFGPNASDLKAHADLSIDEPAAPTQVTLDYASKDAANGHGSVRATLDSTVADFEKVHELKHALAGRAHVTAEGALDLAAMTFAAKARAAASGIVAGASRVDHAEFEASAQGSVAAPRVMATLRTRGVHAGGLTFTNADVTASGPALEPRLTVSVRGPDTPDVEGAATVRASGEMGASLVRVSLALGGERAQVAVDNVVVGKGGVRVDGVRVQGLGSELTAAFASHPGGMRIKARTDGLDLARISRLARKQRLVTSGKFAMDVDLDVGRDRATGGASLDLVSAVLNGVPTLSAHAEVALQGRQVRGKLHADAGEIGRFDAQIQKLDFPGAGPISTSSLLKSYGYVGISGHANLAKVVQLLPPEQRPFSEARGLLDLSGHVARDDAKDVTPDIALQVKTDGLVLSGPVKRSRDIDGVIVIEAPAWRLSGVDFEVTGTVDGDSGAIDLDTQARDVKGPLADVIAKLPHFPEDVFQNSGHLATELQTLPFDVRLVVPERGLGSLPAIVRQTYLTGRVQGELHASGTMTNPVVELAAKVGHSRVSGQRETLALDLQLAGHYDGKKGTLSLDATSGAQDLMKFQANVDAPVAQFLNASSREPAWSAGARAHFAAFPLSAISALNDKLVSGQVSGDLNVTNLHKDGHADAALAIDALQIGSVAYKSAKVDLKADDKVMDGTLRIDQTDGYAETKLHAAESWGAAVAPALDPEKPLDVSLQSKNFRVAVLLPFLEGTLDELDGRLEADTHVQLDAKTKGARLSGSMSLSRGVLEASAGGGELHDLAATIHFNPDGTVTVNRMTASGLTGRLEANASAKLDGTALQSAKGVVTIPENAPIPLTVGGSELGNVNGRIELSATASDGGKSMALAVNVPNLRVALPEGSSNSVQALGPIENVHVGAHRGSKDSFLLLPLTAVKKAAASSAPPQGESTDAATTTVEIQIGDIEVVRGTQLKVNLAGKLNVKSGKTTEVTGQIHLKPDGVLSVQGKNFEIENGTVTMTGKDPSNPEIVLRAGWTAPDGTVVYADFVGPLKTGKVTLSAQPTLTQQEIVQLLLFGTVDGPQAQQPQASTENSSIATAGGEAAQPLNHALNQLGLGSVTANVDTSQSANPKPEVEVQIARGISVELAYVLGIPPPGVNPDSVLLTINWRFLSRWSLSVTEGDKNTTIFDLLWKKRY